MQGGSILISGASLVQDPILTSISPPAAQEAVAAEVTEDPAAEGGEELGRETGGFVEVESTIRRALLEGHTPRPL